MESFNLGQNNIINAYGFIKLFYNSNTQDIYPFNSNETKIILNDISNINHSIIKKDDYIFVLTTEQFNKASEPFTYLTIYFKNIDY